MSCIVKPIISLLCVHCVFVWTAPQLRIAVLNDHFFDEFSVYLSMIITFFVLTAHIFILFLDLQSIGKFCDYAMIQIRRGTEKNQKIQSKGGVFYDYI